MQPVVWDQLWQVCSKATCALLCRKGGLDTPLFLNSQHGDVLLAMVAWFCLIPSFLCWYRLGWVLIAVEMLNNVLHSAEGQT